MQRRTRSGVPAALVVAVTLSCSTEQEVEGQGQDRASEGIDSGTSGASDPDAAMNGQEAPECDIPRYPDSSEIELFERLEARVVDVDGEPVPNITAQACGINLCLFGDTDTDGNVVHTGPQQLRKVAFKYGDGLRYAQLALPLGEGSEHEIGDQITVALPGIETGERFEPGETSSSSGVELTLDPTTHVELDFLSFTDEEHVFLAREFPPGSFPQAAEGEEFEMMFALGPVKTKLCPPAKLRLPNSVSLDPGEPLEIRVHSTDVSTEFAPYAGWAEVSDAAVSDDGRFVETLDGQGLPFLAVIGVKRAPP